MLTVVAGGDLGRSLRFYVQRSLHARCCAFLFLWKFAPLRGYVQDYAELCGLGEAVRNYLLQILRACPPSAK